MAEKSSNQLIPPSKKTVNFLYKGLAFFYPESVFGPKVGKNKASLDSWPETGYRRADFAKLLWNITETEDTDEAARVVLTWKEVLGKGGIPEKTIPENLDEMLSSLDDSATGKEKLSTYGAQTLAKKALLKSQEGVEKAESDLESATTSALDATSRTASPLSAFTFKTAVYLSGPAVHSENPGLATARHFFVNGISSRTVHSFETKARQLNVTKSQLRNLAKLIEAEQEVWPSLYRWFSVVQKARFTQAQTFALLSSSPDGTVAVLPRKSFLGNIIGRGFQQLFGKIASKALQAIGKKVAITAVTAAAPHVGIALFIAGKIKDFVSSLKSKKGRKRLLALISVTMIIGGISLGGLGGGLIAATGFILGIGTIAASAGGVGALGTSAGNSIGTFVMGITGFILPTIVAPAIVAFVSLPLLVAIILFIINSGAYLVPPKPFSETAFAEFAIECTTEKSPVSFSNNTSSQIAKRGWEIVSDLYQGFWCFWNRSPGDFPEDVALYPPSYPNLFNESFFAQNPFPTRKEVQTCGNCLFWCTYLVQKAYRETGNKSILVTLWSPSMQEDFSRRGKFIPSKEATPQNVVSGSVIFFKIVPGPDRTNHVGIVHSTTPDNIAYIQSNAPTKEGSLTFNSSGTGIQNLPGIEIVGIGLP